ncbi:MAG: DUF58 domain-containing protein [Phycisphaerae bacterium]
MPAGDVAEQLLDPDFMARLEQLELVSRKIFAGKMRGERRSKRRGESVEFADYRNYVVGDDLRFLDWNIYARLDRLFLKLFLEEEDLHVSLILDVSRSMDYGNPSKGLYARRVAASIGYIGLLNFDRVSVYPYAEGLTGEMAGMRGRNVTHRLLDFLSRLPYEPASNLSLACKQYAIRHPARGIVVLISDFLDKGGYETGLRYLLGRDLDIYAVQILAPQELEPEVTGDLRLEDVEDNDVAEVTVGRALLNRYKHNLQVYCSKLKEYCTRRGISYLFTSTQVPFDQMVLTYLRRRGLVR